MPRLKTVSRDDLKISRRRSGRGFAYINEHGRVVRDAAFRDRVDALVIPPAWADVRIAPDDNAHIQCCGVDEAGRTQYIYHLDWEVKRSRRKQRSLSLLTRVLPKIRRRVARDLAAEAGTETLALAIAVSLLDRTAMRVGRERYLEEHGTRGAGTLYTRDVKVDGDAIALTFPAKSGKVAEYEIKDARLAAAISRMKTLPGKRLLVYADGGTGKLRPLRTEAINGYLREISGERVTAKDFRTLHASAMAGEALAGLELGESESARKRQIAGVVRDIADILRNTPMVCRKSYIAPCLLKLFDDGKLSALWAKGGSGSNLLRQREQRLGAVLKAVA